MLPEAKISAESRPAIAGRRPADYFDYLVPKARKKRFIDFIKSRYRHADLEISQDLAQEAFRQLLVYRSDLEIGPLPAIDPPVSWYDEAERALQRFVQSRSMKNAVGRIVYTATRGKAGFEQELVDDDEMVDTTWNDSVQWSEDRMHWAEIVKTLRLYLVQHPESDPLVVQIVDQLNQNVCREFFDRKMENVFRGDSFQIKHDLLLASLKRTFPDSDWTIDKLKLALAKLSRHAEKIRESLEKKGYVLFQNRSAQRKQASELDPAALTTACDSHTEENIHG